MGGVMSTDFDWEAAADGQLDDDDVRTLMALREIWQASDPVPAGLADRARFAMTVAALEAEVAEITTATPQESGVRSTVYDRATTVTFSSDSLSAMITIEAVEDGTARISGWVTSAPATVELRERSRTRETIADSAGRFTFTSVERGLVHLVMRSAHDPLARPVITPAIEI